MPDNGKPNYRWYILILATLTHTLAVAMPRMCMPVLFKEISKDLSLSLVQIGGIWGASSLSGVFVSLIGGVLGDRFGVKRTLVVACFLAGLAGALRGLSGGFISLAITTFLFGLLAWMIPMTVHKTAAIWFPGRHLGVANGVLSMGMTVGFMAGAMISATILSPLLGGWRNVLFLYGAASIAISIIWFVTGREPHQVKLSTSSANTVSFRQALSRVARIKNVWLVGFILMGQIGSYFGLTGYLPLYLRDSGWMPASADGATAIVGGFATLATIPMTLLSDRLGSRKAVLIPALSIAAIGTALLPAVNGLAVWGLIIIIGFARGGFMALFITLLMETEGIGAKYAGTAQGLTLTLGQLGGSIAPPLGNSLADINASLPFVFWGILALVTLSGFYFLKETERGKRYGADEGTDLV